VAVTRTATDPGIAGRSYRQIDIPQTKGFGTNPIYFQDSARLPPKRCDGCSTNRFKYIDRDENRLQPLNGLQTGLFTSWPHLMKTSFAFPELERMRFSPPAPIVPNGGCASNPSFALPDLSIAVLVASCAAPSPLRATSASASLLRDLLTAVAPSKRSPSFAFVILFARSSLHQTISKCTQHRLQMFSHCL
jgi:hypothetical protein